jgi:hypothetical protein
MRAKLLAAATGGSLISLVLLLIRPLRRRQLVATEVSALRSLGAAEKAADSRREGQAERPTHL